MFSKHFGLVFASDISQNLTHQVLFTFFKRLPITLLLHLSTFNSLQCYYIFQYFTRQSFRASQIGSTGGEDNFGKKAKNCMKIAKSAFWGQNSGGDGGGQVNVSGSGGISSSPSPPNCGNPECCYYLLNFYTSKCHYFK